jgi:quinolinate synthase
MILWNGSCIVHEIFSVNDLLALKKKLPHGHTIAHPECPANIREHSDFVGGTEAMLKYVAQFAEPQDFLVATEANMMWQLASKHPRHRYHPVPGIACACNKCPHMALNTLDKVRDCLINGKPEITWQPEFDQARVVVTRSLLN